ncbi:hypothetical protein DFH07DRAFT_771496 [Mycena maculata]|uniref:Uncharacterized protein n=1 Tax=Mycena maculata TaxID=230809 RepID=A0AAD7JET9_9AGAR|nr:hypothetical protein DFH07DRAFT_771496 [Mycena maculata]
MQRPWTSRYKRQRLHRLHANAPAIGNVGNGWGRQINSVAWPDDVPSPALYGSSRWGEGNTWAHGPNWSTDDWNDDPSRPIFVMRRSKRLIQARIAKASQAQARVHEVLLLPRSSPSGWLEAQVAQ